jgi:uncharacterized protein (DUF2164 family)
MGLIVSPYSTFNSGEQNNTESLAMKCRGRDIRYKHLSSSSMPPIELSKQDRADALASLKRYIRGNMTLSEPIGDLGAEMLLNYFIEEIGPAIYNRAIADAQARMLQRVQDLDGELFSEPFQYWPRIDRKKKK